MTTHVRKVRKARHRLSKVANARDTIAGFEPGTDIVGLTYGQFSLLDLIEATLEITGPADVTISTWSAGFYDVEAAVRFRDNGLLRTCRFLMDSSAKRGQATPGDVAELFGPDSIRTSRSHAKFVLIRNGQWAVVITSSMNLNLNPRLEQFEMTDDPERYAFFDAFVQSIWTDLPEGWVEDRKLPPATGLEHVEPDLGIELGKVTVGQWGN
ncbi:MAG TPA: hypothetical protein VIG24_14630 [Acidimicrobiia bacterium]